MNTSNLFSQKKINTGRQVELDIAKGLSIIFMVFLHTFYVAGAFHSSYNPTFSFIIMKILGRPFAAVIFMFCMGVGIVYSRHSQWNIMIKRGVKLFLLGILVNVFEFFIPHFVAGALLGKADVFPIAGGLMLFCVDILAFAGLSFILMGILKKLELSNKKLIVIAVVMSIIGTLLRGVDFGIPLVNLFFSYFIGASGGFTAFPLFNWFIIPVAGYIWGQYFIRAKDKNEFFKFWPILLIVALIYFILSSDLGNGILSNNIHEYYFLETIDAIFCILNAHAMIGLCHWIAKYLPDTIIKAFTTLSSNINMIYIAQWFFIPLTIILLAYFAKNMVMHDLLASIIAICILILSTAVALGYKKLKSRS